MNGPVFSVIGIEDCNGDDHPDAVAGASNDAETIGKAVGINGATGSLLWTFTVEGSSVWALEQIDDISGDGIKDVIAGDFVGNIYGLGTSTGTDVWQNSCGNVIITRFSKLDDVNGDSHPDIMPALLAYGSGHITYLIDGFTGQFVWSTSVADKPAVVERIDDITWDGINDVVVGTLYTNNYWYFFDGVNGTILKSGPYASPVDAITAIPDIVGDSSMELVVGGRDGQITCYSGGYPVRITRILLQISPRGLHHLLFISLMHRLQRIRRLLHGNGILIMTEPSIHKNRTLPGFLKNPDHTVYR